MTYNVFGGNVKPYSINQSLPQRWKNQLHKMLLTADMVSKVSNTYHIQNKQKHNSCSSNSSSSY